MLSASPAAVIRATGHGYLLNGWGRTGDAAVVAETPEGIVGAAWYRSWSDELHSYGYIDATTPELGVGVEPGWRGQGIGRALMEALLAAALRAGVRSISLSVESDNPAVALYESLGFVRFERVADSWTMVRELAQDRGAAVAPSKR